MHLYRKFIHEAETRKLFRTGLFDSLKEKKKQKMLL